VAHRGLIDKTAMIKKVRLQLRKTTDDNVSRKSKNSCQQGALAKKFFYYLPFLTVLSNKGV